MNENILRAIESLCDDIATNTNAEDNEKRANAILALAFSGIFTPEEIEEDYTEDDSVAGAEKDKIKFPKFLTREEAEKALKKIKTKAKNKTS